MKISKSFIVALPFVLAGCNDFFNEDVQVYSTPPAPVSTHSSCGCPVQSQQPAAPAQSTAAADWQPSEGQLVRAGELVMELQKNQGRNPSHAAKATYIQTNMGLSAQQVEIILDELGL